MPITKQALLAGLPPEWPEALLPRIQAQVQAAGSKVVVLDDDPTGNQTVHDVAVLTEWSDALLTGAFSEPEAVVYILTNTRSMPPDAARALNRDVATRLKAAREATGRDFVVISRSDSTLRGHYPDETAALATSLDLAFDATLIVPFFVEGGRITAHDVHYVTEGELLVPAAETEFARDAAFGYTHSNLRAWVSEKHGGTVAPDQVLSVTLEEIRRGGPAAVTAKLQTLSDNAPCIVNAVSYRDLEVVVTGLLAAEAQGKRFLYRTAASFVRVRGGIAPRPLLDRADLAHADEAHADVGHADEAHADEAHADVGEPGVAVGGLIIAGSHVAKTTRQVAAAAALPGVHRLEVAVPALLDAKRRDGEVARVAAAAGELLRAGQEALIVTSRQVITGAASEGGTPGATAGPHPGSLAIGQQVSAALVDIVRNLPVRPAWVIAKGGITSSDIATDALDVRRAWVLGQAIPGVPVWRTGPESRWPRLLYIVFPGNVGDDDALAKMIRVLR
jgi:uncharacterized protein YgbK (DUF1537 family)